MFKKYLSITLLLIELRRRRNYLTIGLIYIVNTVFLTIKIKDENFPNPKNFFLPQGVLNLILNKILLLLH